MKRYLTLFSVLGLCWTISSKADVIYVQGDISGVWSADTVIVTGEVRVPPGETLVIDPGVSVLFERYCKLIVDRATLSAVGTPTDSIRFDVLPPNSSWHGIRFLTTSNSSHLEYCILTHGSATGGSPDDNGGAIYCSNSNPTIGQNTISGNSAGWGGAISCAVSSPVIYNNIISRNSADGAGGIFCTSSSNPIIRNNIISDNSATGLDGGGIYCIYSSNANIQANTISGNSADSWDGGGIFCLWSSPDIINNIIHGNSANGGGGIGCYDSTPVISGNTISGNSASYAGGGIYCELGPYPQITGNTLSGNSAVGGGIYYYGAPTTGLNNCILWGDSQPEIYWYISPPPVTYSDVQGGYGGIGNINADPFFVSSAQHDYRLQWGSPCIDAGDPNPIYNDPDATRADMGAWYYDQSMPVRVLLTPYDPPIQIPASGGSFQYRIQATNIDSVTLPVLVWCDVTLPSGMIYGPVLGPVTVPLGSGQTLSRLRTQAVPAGAPAGVYHYNAYAVAAGDTSEDDFIFTKLGSGIQNSGSAGWMNTGEEFDPACISAESSAVLRPRHHLISVSPNPFNPSTILSYQLSAAGLVRLMVYDTAGRLVVTMVNGWRDAGTHEVTFDASSLPSGIYFARLATGNYTAVQKMVLMK